VSNPLGDAVVTIVEQAKASTTVRDIATVTVSEPVKNRVPRKRHHGPKKAKAPVQHIKVLPEVMAAAQALVRPGITKLQIVSAECVMVVNVCEATKKGRAVA